MNFSEKSVVYVIYYLSESKERRNVIMNCKRCGAPVLPDAKVCQSCGLKEPAPYWQKPNSSAQNAAKKPANSNVYQNSRPQNPQPKPEPGRQQQNASASAPVKKAEKSPWKKFAAIAAVALIIGCILFFSNDSVRIKGTWEYEDGSYSITFSDDKNGYLSENGIVYSSSQYLVNFTYYIDGDELELKTEETLFENSVVIRFEFDISGNKLVLKEIESGEMLIHYKADN